MLATALAGCVVVSCSAGGGGSARQQQGTTGTGGAGTNDGNTNPVGGVIRLATCGNSVVDPGEDCDDGNTSSGDGCNRVCQIEADYVCKTPGQPCVYSAVCGDGKLATSESCDDGNAVSGDGCSADCKTVEPGFVCRAPGKRCVPLCGDKIVTPPETCDDGNATSGDGCSSGCLTEPGWSCTSGTCVKSVCGNGTKDTGEACDQGKLNGLFYGDGMGCSKTCTLEPNCRDASGKTQACSTACGDANVDPGEACDDGNQVNGDGCSATCTVEGGFTCDGAASKDTQTCASGMGDCLELPITYRDFDGQQAPSGHPDFFFLGATVGGKKTVCVPNASGKAVTLTSDCADTDSTDLCSGLVEAVLGPDGKPTLNAANGSMCKCRFTDWDQTGVITNGMPNVTQCNVKGDGSKRYRIEQPVQVIQSADTFKQWYSDSTFSTKVLGTLELTALAGMNQYQFSSSGGRTVYDDLHDVFLRERGATTGVDSLSSGFFPLEDQTRTKVCNIWPYWKFTAGVACTAGTGLPVPTQWDPQGWYGNNLMPPMMVTGGPVGTVKPITGVMRNFYFTSQVRYLFHYAGGETLSFYGDDDVWVFINGHLVLDLGAPHERLQGTVSLTGPSADYAIQSEDVLTKAITPIAKGTATGLDLAVGSTYEIAVFHADQHPRESNYELTVSGFSTTRSVCQPKCGDGVATVSEECDDGPQNQDGLYGGCTTQCKLGPFCGDGQKNGPEQCDLGRQNGAAYGTKDGCTTACTTPHYCGDRVLDSAFGEQCDEGDANGGSVCTSDCKLVVR